MEHCIPRTTVPPYQSDLLPPYPLGVVFRRPVKSEMGSIQEQEQEPIDIAIVGGGIGGLALSIGLQQYSHVRVKIYEAASKFSEIGGE